LPTNSPSSDNLANLIWKLEPEYQKINLANVVVLDYLCKIRAEKSNIGTREELEEHDDYIRQMWELLR
jgi:hypothetical protein